MGMTTYFLSILFIAILIGVFELCEYFIEMKSIEREEMKEFNPASGFDMINYLIDTQFSFLIELPFEGKNIKRITDFEDTLLTLTNAVTSALNQNFIRKMVTHGISEKYIYEYITHLSTVKILNYMKENNAGITKGNEEDEEE